MPWYDPYDYWINPRVIEDVADKKKDYTDAIRRAQEKLRGTTLKKRTSTYKEGSIRQSQGAYAECDAQSWLRDELVCAGSDWEVLLWQESRRVPRGFGPFDDELVWVAIDNAKNGDLYVYRPGKGLWSSPDLLFSIEVKSSDKWPNVSITWNELTDSSARYLLGVTRQGTWICTMDDARKNALVAEKQSGGSYWVVPHDRIKKLTIKEIIDAEENPKPAFNPHWASGRDDVPF